MKIFVWAALAGLAVAPAAASPCGQRIASLEKRFGEAPAPGGAGLTGAAAETTGALLHHQPKAASVNDAEQAADSPQSVRAAEFKVAIEQAHAADDAGDARGCETNADAAQKALAR